MCVKQQHNHGIALLEMAIMTMVLVPLLTFSALISELLVQKAEWHEIAQSRLQDLRAVYRCRNDLSDLAVDLDLISLRHNLNELLVSISQTIKDSQLGEWFEQQAGIAVFSVSGSHSSKLLFRIGDVQASPDVIWSHSSFSPYLEVFFNIKNFEDLSMPSLFVELQVNLVPTNSWTRLLAEFDSIQYFRAGAFIRTQVDWS